MWRTISIELYFQGFSSLVLFRFLLVYIIWKVFKNVSIRKYWNLNQKSGDFRSSSQGSGMRPSTDNTRPSLQNTKPFGIGFVTSQNCPTQSFSGLPKQNANTIFGQFSPTPNLISQNLPNIYPNLNQSAPFSYTKPNHSVRIFMRQVIKNT